VRPIYVFTNRVYPPLGGATGELLKEMAEELARGGARVVVVTSRGPADMQLAKQERVNGVELIRVGGASFTRATHFRRAWSYAGLYPQLAWQVWRMGAVDATVSMTDPPMHVAVMALAAYRAKKRIHWAQDIYPELAAELGVFSLPKFMVRILQGVSTWALQRQHDVVVLGRDMQKRVIARGVDVSRVDVIANWSSVKKADTEDILAKRKQLRWDGKFVAMYSGNLGLAHDFETLVKAADLLRGSDVRLVFAGEGPRLERLRQAMVPFEHVSFLPPQPRMDLGAFLGAADVHLVTVRRGLSGLVVPSKVYGILAVGGPLLYVGPLDSDVAKLLQSSGAGVSVKNGDAEKVAQTLRSLAGDPTKLAAMGRSSQHLAKTFTLANATRQWSELLR